MCLFCFSLFRVSFLHDVWCHFRQFGFHFGVILVSFWCPWGSFGDPGPPGDPPREPSRKSDEKVGSRVLPGIAKQAFCRHGMVVFEVCVFLRFFVMLLNCRSVRTELDFLTKMLVRGSSPAGPNFNKIREKSRKSHSEEHVGRHCAHGAAQEVPQDPLQP